MKFNYYYILALLFLKTFYSHTQSLDELGIQYNTDKSSLFHSYTKIYEKYFKDLKNEPIKFLEIGFCRGASAHMWEKYFNNAQLFFIDIDPSALNFLDNFKRTSLHFVNQEDPAELNQFIEQVGSDFDIIIDDGGHTMNQQITSFKILFPHLKSGGIYVIEDLHTSYPYGPNYALAYGSGNPAQQTAVEFLKTLIDCVNLPGARTTCADVYKCSRNIISDLPSYAADIEGIHFYCSLCFIFKK